MVEDHRPAELDSLNPFLEVFDRNRPSICGNPFGVGDQTQFLRALSKILPVEQALQIGRELQERSRGGGRPEDWGGTLTQDLARAALYHHLFSTPYEQVERVLDLNERVFHDDRITTAAIAAAGDPPECPMPRDNWLAAPLLVYSPSYDVDTNLLFGWTALRSITLLPESTTMVVTAPDWWPFAKGIADKRTDYRLGEGTFKWEIIELGRWYRGLSPDKAASRLICDQTGVRVDWELLWAAVLHPVWATSYKGNILPRPVASGLEINHPFGYDHRVGLRLGAGRPAPVEAPTVTLEHQLWIKPDKSSGACFFVNPTLLGAV